MSLVPCECESCGEAAARSQARQEEAVAAFLRARNQPLVIPAPTAPFPRCLMCLVQRPGEPAPAAETIVQGTAVCAPCAREHTVIHPAEVTE